MLVLATLAVAASPAHAEQRYAVLIGANPGWSSDRPLKYAENDAEKLKDVLVALGNFSSDRVAILRDPDTSEVRATLRDLARTVKGSSEDTLVFFYYSGHADDTQVHLRGDPLTFKEIQQTLRALPSTLKLGVIDACKSGAVTNKGGKRTEEFVVDVDSPKLSGMVMLTSSGADELSQESRSLQGSVFTHHLVSALRGAADDNNDSQVTVSEAYHYAYTRTQADTATAGTPQRPAFRYELSGQGELVLAQLKSSKTAKVTLPKGETKYVVLDKNEYRLVAEARADKGPVELTLAPGTYKVKKVLGDRLEVGSLMLAAGEKASVESLKYASAPLSAGVVKGNIDDLPPEEQRDYRRTQAFGILQAGQAQAALEMFDTLLREQQDDMVAWRGRARALVRIAEAYQRVGDHLRERLALNDAIKADPGLTEDPMFTIWYKRLGDLDARAQATFDARQKIEEEKANNPRREKRFGLGFDLVSGRGVLAITGTLVVFNWIMPRVAIDPFGPGLDAGVVIAPYPGRWSPYVGVGAHISFAKLGLIDEEIPTTREVDMMGNPIYDHAEVFGRQVHGEIGAQFVSRAGFTTELGLAVMGFETYEGRRETQVYPILHFGWMF